MYSKWGSIAVLTKSLYSKRRNLQDLIFFYSFLIFFGEEVFKALAKQPLVARWRDVLRTNPEVNGRKRKDPIDNTKSNGF